MGVLAHQAVGQLVRLGLAGEIGAGIEQALHGGGGRFGRRMAGEPVGIAATGFVAGDVEHILGAEVEPVERPAGRAGERDMGLAAKGAELVPLKDIRRHGL